jgi:methionine-rich copper-binding protein CopC
VAVLVLLVAAAAGAFAAAPAGAHAILLRTDPSPQSTAKSPPPAIRLVFSERVEVAFGAVRAFDVDGKPLALGAAPLPRDRR